jgi:hypothetical protein
MNSEWERVTHLTKPAFTRDVLLGGQKACAEKFVKDLSEVDHNRVFVVSSPYGREHSYFFILGALYGCSEFVEERVVIVNNQEDLDIIKSFCQNKICIINFNCEDGNMGDANTYIMFSSFIDNPDVELQLITQEIRDEYRKAVEEMGINSDNVYNVCANTSYNISALKRLLSTNPLLRRPKWAQTKERIDLIPLAIMTIINPRADSHIEVLKSLIGDNVDGYLEKLDYWAEEEDTPIFKYSGVYKIQSKAECVRMLALSYMSPKVQKAENKLKEIFKTNNLMHEDNKRDWYINNGERIRGSDVIMGLLNLSIILSMKSNPAQLHYDLLVKEILQSAETSLPLLKILKEFFVKLAELSPSSYSNWVDNCIKTKNQNFRALIEADAASGMPYSYSDITYIVSGLDICLRVKETAAQSLRTFLKLYLGDYKLPGTGDLKDVVATRFSLIYCSYCPLTMSEKTEILFSFLSSIDETEHAQQKIKPLLTDLLDGGKSSVVVGVHETFKVPTRMDYFYSIDEINKLQQRSIAWLVQYSDNNEIIDILDVLIHNIHTLPLTAFQQKIDEIATAIERMNDSEKAQIKAKILHHIYTIQHFRSSWVEEQKFIPMLKELYDQTLVADLYDRVAYIFKNDQFPFFDPMDTDDDKWYEDAENKRSIIRKETIRSLVQEYGDAIIERVIRDYHNSMWQMWNDIYDISTDHDRDIKILEELREKQGLGIYLLHLDTQQLIQYLQRIANTETIEWVAGMLPLSKELIAYFDGKEEEKYYWQKRRVWMANIQNDAVIFGKLLKFYPMSLVVCESKHIQYDRGMQILNAIIAKGDISSQLKRDDTGMDFAYYLRKLLDILDNNNYADELAYVEFQLLPYLIGGYQSDYPKGVKRFFWEHPDELSKFIVNLKEKENELEYGSFGRKLLHSISFSFGNKRIIPIEYLSQKKNELSEWYTNYVAEGNGKSDEMKCFLSCALIDILALCPFVSGEPIWPNKQVADLLEKASCEGFEDKDDASSCFYCAYINSRGIHTVTDGAFELEQQSRFNKYADYYSATNPVTAQALRYIANSYGDEGERDKRFSVLGGFA